ncbi:MAG: hypothetical protein P8Z49_10735, partial [Acidobacteriota bacterium]
MHSFEVESELPAKASEVLAWLSRPRAFERLLPPWWDAEVVQRYGKPSTVGTLEVQLGSKRRTTPLKFSFRDYNPDLGFSTVIENADRGSWELAISCLSSEGERCRLVERFSGYTVDGTTFSGDRVR